MKKYLHFLIIFIGLAHCSAGFAADVCLFGNETSDLFGPRPNKTVMKSLKQRKIIVRDRIPIVHPETHSNLIQFVLQATIKTYAKDIHTESVTEAREIFLRSDPYVQILADIRGPKYVFVGAYDGTEVGEIFEIKLIGPQRRMTIKSVGKISDGRIFDCAVE